MTTNLATLIIKLAIGGKLPKWFGRLRVFRNLFYAACCRIVREWHNNQARKGVTL